MATIKQTLIDLFKLDQMEPEKAEKMTERLAGLVFQAVLMRALPMLSPADLEEYEKIVDSKMGPEALFTYLAEKVPGFENMVAEEAEILRREFSGELEALQS